MIHTACFALLLVGGTLSQGRRIHNQVEEVQLFANSEINSKHLIDADCTSPECYSWSVTGLGDCNLDAGGQQTVQAPIAACIRWFRAYRWYKLQFQLREHAIGGLPQLNNGGRIYAESRCYQKANMATLDYPGVTTAIIRSPGIGGSSGCDIYQLSFWYLLSSEPHFSDDDAERSYLEVFRQYSPRGTPANQIPTDLLWGSRSDYDLGFPGPNTWSKATVEFSADALFTLNFFAHHPNNCIDNGTIIAVDSITTLRAVRTECSTSSRKPTELVPPEDSTVTATTQLSSPTPGQTILVSKLSETITTAATVTATIESTAGPITTTVTAQSPAATTTTSRIAAETSHLPITSSVPTGSPETTWIAAVPLQTTPTTTNELSVTVVTPPDEATNTATSATSISAEQTGETPPEAEPVTITTNSLPDTTPSTVTETLATSTVVTSAESTSGTVSETTAPTDTTPTAELVTITTTGLPDTTLSTVTETLETSTDVTSAELTPVTVSGTTAPTKPSVVTVTEGSPNTDVPLPFTATITMTGEPTPSSTAPTDTTPTAELVTITTTGLPDTTQSTVTETLETSTVVTSAELTPVTVSGTTAPTKPPVVTVTEGSPNTDVPLPFSATITMTGEPTPSSTAPTDTTPTAELVPITTTGLPDTTQSTVTETLETSTVVTSAELTPVTVSGTTAPTKPPVVTVTEGSPNTDVPLPFSATITMTGEPTPSSTAPTDTTPTAELVTITTTGLPDTTQSTVTETLETSTVVTSAELTPVTVSGTTAPTKPPVVTVTEGSPNTDVPLPFSATITMTGEPTPSSTAPTDTTPTAELVTITTTGLPDTTQSTVTETLETSTVVTSAELTPVTVSGTTAPTEPPVVTVTKESPITEVTVPFTTTVVVGPTTPATMPTATYACTANLPCGSNAVCKEFDGYSACLCIEGFVQQPGSLACQCPVSQIYNTSTLMCEDVRILLDVTYRITEYQYSESLNNKSSAEFQELATQFSAYITDILRNAMAGMEPAETVSVEVIGFRRGSVLADVVIKYTGENITKLNSSLYGPPTESIILGGTSYDITRNTTADFFNRCEQSGVAWCGPGTECRFIATSGINTCPCISAHIPGGTKLRSCRFDPCGASPCGQHAECIVDSNYVDSRRCRCQAGYFRTFTQPEDAPCLAPYVILYVVAGVTVGVVLLLTGLFCWLIRRNKRHSTTKNVRTQSIELSDQPYPTGQRFFVRKEDDLAVYGRREVIRPDLFPVADNATGRDGYIYSTGSWRRRRTLDSPYSSSTLDSDEGYVGNDGYR